jgi:hypothetical protein
VNEPNEYSVRIAVLETKLTAADEARALQAREYERRLSDLNHAHAQAEARNANFVRMDIYDAGMKEMRAVNGVLRDAIEDVSRKVYIGIGIVLTIQVIIFVVIEVWKR